MACRAQDDLLEYIQPEYHTMPFSHSQHLVTKKRSLKFNQYQFTRYHSKKRKHDEVESSGRGHDPAKVRKPTSVPKRLPERNAVSEYISKVGICHEIPGRIYDRMRMWKALDDMDDDLLGDKKAQEAMEREMEMMSDGDRIMTTWVDDLYKAKEKISSTCIGDEAARRHAASLLLLFQEGASEGPNTTSSSWHRPKKGRLEKTSL